VYEGRTVASGFAHHLDHLEAAQDFLPQDFQLQLRKAIADAAVDPKAKGQMLARPRTVDDEPVG